jgi:hypothetical protein
MWIAIQVVGCLLIALALTVMRQQGLNWTSWGTYAAVTMLFTSWAFPISFKLAPSFFQIHFLGIALLTICGFVISLGYFKESVSMLNYAGAGLTFLGAILLGIK